MSGIPEEITAKLIIVALIAFKHVYIAEIQTTYKNVNADTPSKAWGLIAVSLLLFNFLRKNKGIQLIMSMLK